MPEKIKLTPSELQAQAAEMKSLESEYSSLFGGVSSELNKVNSNWSANLAHNFSGKINSTNKSFSKITQELMNGAKVADTCAVTFESVDTQLAKLYCSDEPSDSSPRDKYSLWDATRDSFGNIPNEFKDLQDAYNSLKEWVGGNDGRKAGVGIVWELLESWGTTSPITGAIDTTLDIIEDPSNIGKFAWNMLETVSSATGINLKLVENILDKIPFYHDYYSSHGGYYEGLVDGIGEISSAMKESIDAHGGFFNAWWDGVKVMFNF